MTAPANAGIFDIHQHVGKLIGIPGSGGADATLEKDVKVRLAFMDAFGIAQAALMPGHSYSSPAGLADTRALNDTLLACQALAPDRFPAIIGTVEPRHGLKSIAEVERLHAAGAAGISWHHRMQGLPMDHPVMFALVERMDALGLIAMAHCYANGDFEAPWRLRRLAERFPRTTFIALDAQTSPENLDQILGAAEAVPNLHLDLTSTVLGVAGIRACVERLGPTRLVFGSNYYSMGVRTELEELELLHAAGLSDADTAMIGGGNARRLLGLDAS